MRRSRYTLALVLLSLSMFPARADAYFWAWLDDLSGPRFVGVVGEAQFLCRYTSAANDLDTIVALQRDIAAAKTLYATQVNWTGDGAKYYQRAGSLIGEAEPLIAAARAELEAQPKSDVTKSVLAALRKRHKAAEYFSWAQHVRAGGPDDPRKRPKPDEHDESWTGARAAFAAPGLGLNVSLCGSKPLHRDRSFFRADIGYGWDVKPETKGQKNRMLAVGISYHWALSPYFTFGTGGGVAHFSTGVDEGRRSFSKLYLQPTIIDFRPAALVRNANLRSPWLHVFFVRHSVIVFPGGFEEGRFGGTSEAYPTEFVSSIGVHADIAPLIRQWRKAW